MRIKVIFVILPFLLLISTLTAVSDEFEGAIERLVADLSEKAGIGGRPMRVSVGNFTYGETKFASAFAYFLQRQLEDAISGSKSFELLDRRELDRILKELDLSLSDLFDPETAPPIGKLKGLEAILTGSYAIWGDTVRVSACLVKVGTTRKFTCSTSIPMRSIPENVRIKPERFDQAVNDEKLFHKPEKGEDEGKGLKVKVWVDRGEGGTYAAGERLFILFKANMDCYVKIYDIPAGGKPRLIFPNRWHADNKVKGDKVYRIPEGDYGFDLIVTEPFGPETLLAVASTHQFPDIEEELKLARSKPFPEVEESARSLSVKLRGLTPFPKSLNAQTICTFTTVPKIVK